MNSPEMAAASRRGSAVRHRQKSHRPPLDSGRNGETLARRNGTLSKRLKPSQPVLPYQNPKLSAAERTTDLLSRMTLEEKAAQMMCIWQQKADKLVDANGKFDINKARAAFKRGHGIG